MDRKRKQQTTVSKGYRLKPSTHKKIRVLGRSLKLKQDDVIGRALELLVKNVSKIKA